MFFVIKANYVEKIYKKGGNMKLSKEEYKEIYQKYSGKSPVLKNCLWAFCVGGGICLLAQLIKDALMSRGFEKELCDTALPVIMVFLGVTLTFFGIYRKIAKKAGAGTLVPITGFANAVSSAAMEFKTEGLITGTAVKMFSIAGPVIVFGTSAAMIYGFIVWLVEVVLW